MYAGGMSRPAARRLAKYLRNLGISCRVLRHAAPGGKTFWTVERT
jgi:hypothetical protein